MKKIFSAFLLMTMMVFSVGSFVSCSDLENEIAKVDTQANANAAAIESLNSEIAALKTALSAAQADADAAMTAAKAAKEAGDAAKAEAEAAKAAAAQAKAEALAAVAEELEAIQTAIAVNVEAITNLGGSVNANAVEIEALQEEVKALQTAAAEAVYAITNLNGSVEKHENAIADLETEVAVLKATIANYEANLKELGLFDEEMKKQIEGITYAITNLDKAVETNTNEIDALKEQLEDVVAQVETLNASLVAIYDILGVLANQIQSVVFVPEFQYEDLVAERFVAGDNAMHTNYIAVGTYEVRPAKLAASLTSENLSFSSVTTKAANAPEYFKAAIIGEPDPATGRVVVAAIINDTDGTKTACAYDQLTKGNVALALNIASVDVTELLIAESAAANVEMVSSEYVYVTNAETTKLQPVFGFPVVNKDGSKSISGTYTNAITVDWNKSADSERELFDTEVCVLMQNEFFSLEEASELLGVNLKAEYKLEATYSNGKTAIKKDEYNPFTVTGKDLTATASFANTDSKVKDAALVGYNTVVTVTVSRSAGKYAFDTKQTATTTYSIGNKQSDFEFADAKKVAWKYTEGDALKESFTQELAVIGFDDMRAKDIEISDFTTEVDDKPFTATVKAASAKAVDVTVPAGLPYKQGEDAVYKFKGTVTYQNVDYTVVFNVTLGAMPVDQIINLGEIKTLGNTTAAMSEDIDVMSQIRTFINDADSNFGKDFAYEKDNVEAFNKLFTYSTDEVAEDDVVTVNGTEVTATAPGYASFALKSVRDTKAKVVDEVSVININKVEKYENTIKVVETYNVCGINFTVKATVVTEEPQLSLEANDFYVKNGVVELDNGVFDLTYNTTTAINETKSSEAYRLEAIDLRKYVHVTVPAGYEGDYQLLYTLETPMYKDDETLLYGTKPVFKASTAIVDNKVNVPNVLTWNVDLNSLTFKVALASKTAVDEDDKPVVFDTETITLTIPQLVTFAADSAVVVKYVPGQDAVANIAKAMTVVDNHKNAVYNPYAKNVTEFFAGYYETLVSGKVTGGITTSPANFFSRIYNMNVVLPKQEEEVEKIEVYLDGVKKDLSMVSYDFDNTNGILTLKKDNGNITGDVEFRIKVGLTHLYDNYSESGQPATVSVVFAKDAVVEDGPAEAVLPTPAKGQYVGEFDGNKLIVNLGVGTLKTPDETIENPFAFVLDMGNGSYMYEPSMIYTSYEFEPATSETGIIYGTNAEGSAPWEYSDLTATSMTMYIGPTAVKLTKVADKDMIAVIEWK